MKFHIKKPFQAWAILFAIALSILIPAQQVQAENYRYRFYSLANAKLPLGYYFFSHNVLGEDGKLYGTLFNEDGVSFTSGVYENGVVSKILGTESIQISAVGKSGLIGGTLITNDRKAVVFEHNFLKFLPGDEVPDINDKNVVLLADQGNLSIYKHGINYPINIGLENVEWQPRPTFNNQETIAGTMLNSLGNYRGFRLDKGKKQPVILNPLPTETDSKAFDINNLGNVLGYSYIVKNIQRIGFWQRNGKFKTYFTEGTAEYPTISNYLFFNDKNEIVITGVEDPKSEINTSYLVPKPGVRLNLSELVENLPKGQDLCNVQHINNRGDISGYSCESDGYEFLLKRIGSR